MESDILTSIGTNQDAVDTLVRSLIDIRSPLSPANPQIQGAFTTDAVSSAVGPQPIDPKKRSMVKSSTPKIDRTKICKCFKNSGKYQDELEK